MAVYDVQFARLGNTLVINQRDPQVFEVQQLVDSEFIDGKQPVP